MSERFHSFILLAEMRTGSNFLEENINQIEGLTCWGEAFNPHFMGRAGQTELAGVTLTERERDPVRLLDAIRKQTDGLGGFRFFHDHDARVLDRLLPDQGCAKIVLTRNPLDSYVSLKIARATNQWRLSDMKNAKSARITFDAGEFDAHVNALRDFQLRVLKALQASGQTAFYLAYEDAGDLDVLNGLAAYLEAPGRIERLARATKVQNPGELEEKVENYDEMVAVLGRIDHFDLGRTPAFEPRRGPAIPSYVSPRNAPLLFMPLPGGPTDAVEAWLAAIDETGLDGLLRERTQKDLRKWKRQNTGHRSFTVLRHPVPRLHEAFCRHILVPGPDCFDEIRGSLRSHYGIPIPEGAPDRNWDANAHRAAFLSFAQFIKGNLGGQTSLRVDPSWASQSALLQGMASFSPPDMILREHETAERLPELARAVGISAPSFVAGEETGPVPLSVIYDPEIEAAVRAAYQRDYMMFGFDAWR